MNLASAHKTRKDQQAVPRVMKASALDGPGTNSQQVENRREFRDKTNVGQVFKLSTSFAHFAAEDERHISTKDNNAKKSSNINILSFGLVPVLRFYNKIQPLIQ